MKRLLLILLLCLYGSLCRLAAQTAPGVVLDWRQHNLIKYNRMLVNPTYSIAGEETKAISFWSRVQWTGIANSPQTFLLNYSGKIGEHSGAGVGLYQQSLGLMVDSGLLMNYAYRVQLGPKLAVSLGLNSTFFRRGLDRNAVNAADPDPIVLENQDDFLLLLMPGINITAGKFDLGFYAENLFDYNLNQSRTVSGLSDKIYSGQLGFTIVPQRGLLRQSVWRTITYAKKQPNAEIQYGIGSLIDLPDHGWFQMGYNSTYGLNGALGVKLGDGISVGVIYENGNDGTGNNFGPTYEAMATIELGHKVFRNNNELLLAKQEKEEEELIAEIDQVQEAEPEASTPAPTAPGMVSGNTYAVYAGNNGDSAEPEAGTQLREPEIPEPVSSVVAVLEEEERVSAEEEEISRVIERASSGIVEESLREDVTDLVFDGESSYKSLVSAEGIIPGYYLVVNVFSKEHYFEKFVSELKARGFTPLHFVHPVSKFWYVYLQYDERYTVVKQLQRNHYRGDYRDDKWVLRVTEL